MDPDYTILFDGKAIERKNKKYLKAENTKLTFTISKLIFNLGNLYNGDKLLGDGTNLFLNENWSDVFNEINKSVFDAFSQIIENVLNNIFQKVPYDDLFAKDGWHTEYCDKSVKFVVVYLCFHLTNKFFFIDTSSKRWIFSMSSKHSIHFNICRCENIDAHDPTS